MSFDIEFEDYQSQVGREVGLSQWRLVDQSLIDSFAAITEDNQFIHVDPDRAAMTPFGSTIAHGMLVLSLIGPMGSATLPLIRGRVMSINYGFDRVRFIAPVPVGSRLRSRFILSEINRRRSGQILTHYAVSVEREGSANPVAVVDWLTMTVLASPTAG